MEVSKSLMKWPILNLLNSEFISNIHMVFVHGSSGTEALIVTQDKMVYALGLNKHGCCGTGDTHSLLTPKKVDELCDKDIKTFAYGSNSHILALTQDGKVYAWGDNSKFQLGNGSVDYPCLTPTLVEEDLSDTFVVDIACGKFHSLALTHNGEVYEWGLTKRVQNSDRYNSLVRTPRKVQSEFDGKKVVCISCGDSSSMAVTADGEVYAWGDNSVGQLGIGNYNHQASPCKVTKLTGTVIKKVVCGYMHTLALSNKGILYSWGSNTYGQLGCSSDTNVCSPQELKMPLPEKVLDMATSQYNHISVAMGECRSVFIWGQCLGQSINIPMLTPQRCLYDALACYATPSVMHKPFVLQGKRKTDLTECLEKAFDDPTTSDLTIQVQEKPIHVHKAILKIRCEYFRTMFQKHWAENNQSVIKHEHFSYDVYRAFLKYLYTDQIDLPTESVAGLLDLAITYCDNVLKDHCVQLIKSRTAIENVALFYNIGIKYGIKELEDFCFQFALNNMTAVIQSPNFSELDGPMAMSFIIKAAKAHAFAT